MIDLSIANAEDYKSKCHPKIKSTSMLDRRKTSGTFTSNSSKSLKRMREASASLQSIENIMPSPLKRIRSCLDNSELGKPGPLKRIQSCMVSEEFAKPFDVDKKPPTRRGLKRTGSNLSRSGSNALSKVASFAKGFSPRKSIRMKMPGQLQRSASLRGNKTPSPTFPRAAFNNNNSSRKQMPTPHKRRGSMLWVDSIADFESEISDILTPQQIKRQEGIYELYCGETDLIEDIKLLKEVYFNPITTLRLLSDEDLNMIFGSIQVLLPLHEELVKQLEDLRNANGSIEEIGKVLVKWIPTLRPYIDYCAHTLVAKDRLEEKMKENSHFSDFLQRCHESPFSRKLPLWSFLDSPRTRLVKYPLLINNIYKHTPKEHPDRTELHKSKELFETLLREVDQASGVTKCKFYKDRFQFMEDSWDQNQVTASNVLICSGSLKNKNGTKCEAFLFDKAFVLTRLGTSKAGQRVYMVYAQPLDVSELEVTDLPDGEVRIGGSFRTTLKRGPLAKDAIRLSTRDPLHGKSYILQAHDYHDKKQWLNAFYSVTKKNSAPTTTQSSLELDKSMMKSPSSSEISITL